jgi:formamidopyrimidine-DNA glycosylase
MPELPEVEVIRRALVEAVIDRAIASVRLAQNNYAFLTPPQDVRRHLVGHRFERIDRRGKYLLFALDDQSCLVIHLGMTGQLFSSRALSPRLVQRSLRHGPASECFQPDQHTHMSIAFEDAGEQLHYRDARKFGKILWLAPSANDVRLERLGPDAATITSRQLTAGLAGRRSAIKPVLLDQAVLAGVGNIYADESLHAAGIAPTRAANVLTASEIDLLARSIRQVLKRAIRLGGSSIDDYLHPDGSDGGFQKRFAVYAREGQPCKRCGATIQRLVIGQRSAHFCGGCQR